MPNKRPAMRTYRALKLKILGKTLLLFLLAVASLFALYKLILHQRFADFVVQKLDRLIFHDYEAAMDCYQAIFRNHYEFLTMTAILLVFGFALYIYLHFFTRYFQEIHNGIDGLLHRERAIALSPELEPIEKKLRTISQELAQKEQAARDAEQRKDDLVLYLAHDIRTPLTSVIGYLHFLEETPDMPREQRIAYTRIALEKADRLDRMVHEFFEITQLHSQHLALRRERIDLYYMLQQITDEMTPLLVKNGNTIALACPENVTLFGDPEQLARVCNNLLKNAAAYSTPQSAISLSVTTQAEKAILRFQNEGRGIAKERLALLFEPFYRMDEARSANTGGAGLGLAIAKEIVTMHGGTIEADSDAHTVCFTVTLPTVP